jgi:hypothetical protein
MTQNQKWSHIQTLIIPDGLVADSGTNVLAFDNKLNPRKSAPLWWGVRNVDVFAPIPLSDGGAYGYIPHGDRSHANHVQFVFEGRPGDITVSYEDFDIDFEDEVQIIVNGQMIGNAKMTANQEWGDLTSITIPDTVVEDSGPNILTFDNKGNPNPKISNPLWWGIRSVAVF